MRTETPYDDNYATCVATFAWLRVMGEDLNPDEVTAKLNIQPTKIQRKGALPREGSRHPYKYSGWFLESEGHVQSRDSRRHLDWILEQIQDQQEAFAELRAEKNLVDVCCRWDSSGHGGPTLSPSQMEALARLRIELWFDVYFAKDESAA